MLTCKQSITATGIVTADQTRIAWQCSLSTARQHRHWVQSQMSAIVLGDLDPLLL